MGEVYDALTNDFPIKVASERDSVVIHPADGQVRFELCAEACLARTVDDGTNLCRHEVGTLDGLGNDKQGRVYGTDLLALKKSREFEGIVVTFDRLDSKARVM